METFSYCIGSYWPGTEKTISAYAYGSTIFHGDIKSAVGMRNFLSERAGEKLKIFKLIEIKTKLKLKKDEDS